LNWKASFSLLILPKLAGFQRFRKARNGLRGRKAERFRAYPGNQATRKLDANEREWPLALRSSSIGLPLHKNDSIAVRIVN
jgi:hypothetical protein